MTKYGQPGAGHVAGRSSETSRERSMMGEGSADDKVSGVSRGRNRERTLGNTVPAMNVKCYSSDRDPVKRILPRRRGDLTMSIKLGSAPDSWGVWFANDPRQTPWPRF